MPLRLGRRTRSWRAVAAELRTVGLIVGPYRSLTTLTAALLSLHPRCQVLNHAGPRLLRSRRDFIERCSEARLMSFCASALQASTGGERGGHGGSIRLSHAFDRERVRQVYAQRFGDAALKDRPTCLVWKESQIVTNRMRARPGGAEELLRRLPRLRLLMPVRHPLDCALSNVRTGHAKHLPGADPSDPVRTLDRILEGIAWFAPLAAAQPERCAMFFEDDAPDRICDVLQSLFDLEDDAEWRAAVAAALDVRGESYQHSAELRDGFELSLQAHFAGDDPTAARLRQLVDAPAPARH